MANDRWVVEAVDAYRSWVLRAQPSPEQKGFVVNWLAEREELGPPEGAVTDEKQNCIARAGEREFYFRQFAFPGEDPPGYMFVMEIR